MRILGVVCSCLLLLTGSCTTSPDLRGQPASPLHAAQPSSPLIPVDTIPPDCADIAGDTAEINQLGLDLFHILTHHAPAENLVISPYGVAAVFSMAYAGARSATADEMATTLHFLPQAEQHARFQALTCHLAHLSSPGSPDDRAVDATMPFQLHSANGLFPQVGFPLAPGFLTTLTDAYAAPVQPLNYVGDPGGAVEQINGWARWHTSARIDQLMSSEDVTQFTRLVLANAVYFNAAWKQPFSPAQTAPASFTLIDDTQMTVPFMHGVMRAPYLRGDDFQAALLPYAGETVDLLVVLPDPERFDAVAHRLDLGTTLLVDPNTATLNPGGLVFDVTLAMPKFAFAQDVDLIGALQDAGLMLPFDPGAADFSGITGGDNDLFISAARQKAEIVVDENGTEAVAATAAVMPVSALERVNLALDRPFLFAMRDRGTQTVLFLGQVMNPVSSTPSPDDDVAGTAYYRGPNPYRDSPQFEIAYPARLWRLESDDTKGQDGLDLIHKGIVDCSIWLDAGAIGAEDMPAVRLGQHDWIPFRTIDPDSIGYYLPWDDIAFFFGIRLPAPYATDGAIPCLDAAHEVIATFAVVPDPSP